MFCTCRHICCKPRSFLTYKDHAVTWCMQRHRTIFEETDNIACANLDTVPVDLEIRWVQPMPPINLLNERGLLNDTLLEHALLY